MRIWAYGRSPYGLGLSEDDFWSLGFREFDALRKERRKALYRWAQEMALHANIWKKPEATPFIPEDFLGEGDYGKRRAQRDMEQRAVELANAQLAKITAGAPPDDGVPDWAKGPYHGAN